MTAEERYEWAWKQYLVRLNKSSKIRKHPVQAVLHKTNKPKS